MEADRLLTLLRLVNLVSCLPWIHPAIRLIRVTEHMQDNGLSRFGWGFRLLAIGVLVLMVGNSVIYATLLWLGVGNSLLPGLLPPITNIGIGLGVTLLTRISTEDD